MFGEDFYRQFRDRVSGYTGPYGEYVLLAPDLLLLVGKLMVDPRVAAKHKAYLGAALAYVVSPIDLLSERTFGAAGYLDDIAVLVAALNQLINEVDPQIVLQHWSGNADLLAKVREILGQADQLIGKGRLDKILEALGIRRPATGPAA
jgi:uncharacterized membrane protein YkvA (DUF1232 family)